MRHALAQPAHNARRRPKASHILATSGDLPGFFLKRVVMRKRYCLLVLALPLFVLPATAAEQPGLGLGFLIGKKTESLIPLLAREKDFLELMLGPDKVRYVRMLKPPARAMCVSESLAGVSNTVQILRDAAIPSERVYIAYNPEPRPPGARQCTPKEELDDYLASIKKARGIIGDYGAPLIMGPGLIVMAKQEHLYSELARHCDAWMIQSQRLQIDDVSTRKPVTADQYRASIRRIVEMLKKGNPRIQVFVQIIPLQSTPELRQTFTAERIASFLGAIGDLADGAKIYGGNDELISEVFSILRPAKPH